MHTGILGRQDRAMKTIQLSSNRPSVDDLLSMARDEVLVVTTEEGDSFVISSGYGLATEAQLLRRNNAFLAMLDGFKEEEETIPLEEAEKRLR